VIWRLPHPGRGIVTFLAIYVIGSIVGGFGMGLPELALLALVAGGAGLSVATRTAQTGHDRSS
jgi:hypothetical protein